MLERLKGLVVGITEGRKYSNMLISDLYEEYNKIENSNGERLKDYKLKAIKEEIIRKADRDTMQACLLFSLVSKEEANMICREIFGK